MKKRYKAQKKRARRANLRGLASKRVAIPAVVDLGPKPSATPAIRTAEIPVAVKSSPGSGKVDVGTAKIPIAVNVPLKQRSRSRKRNVGVLPFVVSPIQRDKPTASRRRRVPPATNRPASRASGPPAEGPVKQPNLLIRVLDAEENAVNTAARYAHAMIDTTEAVFRLVVGSSEAVGRETTARIRRLPQTARHEKVPSSLKAA